MIFNLRPSKCFSYELLQSALAQADGRVGIDAASANLKHREMFKTDTYYGVDIDLSRLASGIENNPDGRTFGIHADMATLDPLPTGSADVVVSTNTLYCLSSENRRAAVAHLCRITSPRGIFVCETLIDTNFDAVVGILHASFQDVRCIYYKNPVSRWYERFFEYNGEVGARPVHGSRVFKLIAWILSRLEYFTMGSRNLNTNAIFFCTKKKDATSLPFDLRGIPCENKIYRILN